MSYYRVFEAKRRKVATRKPAKWSLFRVFAWRPFAPPHESTKLFMFRLFASCLSPSSEMYTAQSLTWTALLVLRIMHLLRRKKCSLFPLTSPKKLGTVGRHNDFFLLTFFNESYSFLYCKHANFCYFYFNWLKKQVKHHYLDELPTKLQ